MNSAKVIRHVIALLLLVAVTHAQQTPQNPSPPNDAQTPPTLQDSLELRLLDLEIAAARNAAVRNSFWHRLIPRISLSTSFSAHDALFVDPASSQSVFLPRDAYRLTASLSLSDLLDGSGQSETELHLARLLNERAKLADRQEIFRRLLARKLWTNEKELGMALDACRLAESVVNFKQLLFDQGKVPFDALMNAKLELLGAAHTLVRLALLQYELKLGQPESTR